MACRVAQWTSCPDAPPPVFQALEPAYGSHRQSPSRRARVPWVGVASLAVAALTAACGADAPSSPPTQAAARVEDGEITVHQVNVLLQRQSGPAPEDTAAAARVALERLIDQELAVRRARELGVDREPALVQEIESARREILARAWADRAAAAAAAPGDEEIRRHYEANPALYAHRREFSLQEIVVEATPEQVQALRQRLGSGARMGELLQALRETGLRWRAQPLLRTAEQMPPAALQALESLRDGQALLSNTPRGAIVLVRLGSRERPLSLEVARDDIAQRLRMERRREIVQQDLQAMRAAARIEYLGPFAAAPSTEAPK